MRNHVIPATAEDRTQGTRAKLSTITLGSASVALFIIGLGTALRYVMQVLLARWLGPAQYGSYAIAWTWLQLCAVAAAPGVAVAGLRYVSEYLLTDQRAALHGLLRWSRTTVAIGSAIVGALMFVGLRVLTPQVGLACTLIAVGLLPLQTMIRVTTEWLRAAGSIWLAFSPAQILVPAVAIPVVFAVHRAGHLNASSALMLAGSALFVAVMSQQIGLRRWLPVLPHGVERARDGRLWWHASIPMFLQEACRTFMGQWDVVIVGIMLTSHDAGVYTAAARTSTVVSLALTAVNSVAAPVISSHHLTGDYDQLQHVVRRATRWSFGASLFVCAFLSLFPEVVLGVFGVPYRDGAWALRWLAIGQLVNGSTGPVGYLLVLTGNQTIVARIFALSAGVSLVLSVLLIEAVGAVGAAVASSAALVVANLLMYQTVRSRLGIKSFALAWR